MTVITIDTEMAEALMEIKSRVPQINPRELKKAVFKYYEKEEDFQILENLPLETENALNDLIEIAHSPQVDKIIEEKRNLQMA